MIIYSEQGVQLITYPLRGIQQLWCHIIDLSLMTLASKNVLWNVGNIFIAMYHGGKRKCFKNFSDDQIQQKLKRVQYLNLHLKTMTSKVEQGIQKLFGGKKVWKKLILMMNLIRFWQNFGLKPKLKRYPLDK